MKELLFMLLAICLVATTGYTASNKEDYELQEKCARDAKQRFYQDFKDNPAMYYKRVFAEGGTQKRGKEGELEWEAELMPYVYENHFNRKMNRCFMYVSASNVAAYLLDVNEVTPLASISLVQDLQSAVGGETFACLTKGKKCDSRKDFSAFIKPYMEE